MTAGAPWRIAIDPQIFHLQHHGGVSRYFAELALELEKRPDVSLVLPFRRSRSVHLAHAFPGRFATIPEHSRLSPGHLAVLDPPRLRRRGGVDLVHHSWYRLQSLKTYRGGRRVCTVHDMIPEKFPEIYAHRDPHSGKREHVEAADAIACNSESTRADLLRHWGPIDKPIHVTPLAVADTFFEPGEDVTPPARPYVLFVGRRDEYKNFRALSAAFEILASRHHDLHLVCVGGGPLRPDEIEPLERRGIADRVHQVDVAEADLRAYYRAAACFVFPSIYEGFGLPVLEAFASGTPVVVADTPSLVEVAGGRAEVASPHEPEDLAAAVERLLRLDRDERGAMVDAARSRAREFTWRRTADATTDLYRTVLAG